MKETFLTTLEKPEAEFIRKQGLIFGSQSRAIRVALRVLISLVNSGIVRFTQEGLHEILANNKNPMSADSGSPGRCDGSAADTSPRMNELHCVATPRRYGAAKGVAVAFESPFCPLIARTFAIASVIQ